MGKTRERLQEFKKIGNIKGTFHARMGMIKETVKGFCVVNETEVDFFWNSLAFSMIQWMLAV